MAGVYTMAEADHARVSAAVAAAEEGTAGEIVTIVADHSDRYLDVAMWWATGAAMLALALLALFPHWPVAFLSALTDGWGNTLSLAEAFEFALAAAVLAFALVRLLLQWMPARMLATPRVVKAQRVRRRALRYFKVGAQSRTVGRTGVLIYLSMSEHVAEIVADAAIHNKVPAEAWGEAMAKLVGHVREGRVADGMVAAIGDVGVILAAHFPRAADDANELPDRLIEL